MLSTIIFNFIASLIAFSVSGSIVLHDTRLDKAFMSPVSSVSYTSIHDFGRSLMSDQHVHSHESVTAASMSDPMAPNRSHKRVISLPHERVRLSAISL